MLLLHLYVPVVSAQNQSNIGSAESVIKVLIEDAIQALHNGNTTKTIQNLFTNYGINESQV